MNKLLLLLSLFCTINLASAQRRERTLLQGWTFHRGETIWDAPSDKHWKTVTLPHDWAIEGPFSSNIDIQNVAVTQNGEHKASLKTGRTGGLPYIGVGWYRTSINATPNKRTTLLFDGAMSEARVFVNGQEAIFWPYGYSSFYVDITSLLRPGENSLAVRLENRPESSRWYPGAGLYRKVWMITTNEIHIDVWGTQITTPHISSTEAEVNIKTSLRGAVGHNIRLLTHIQDPLGTVVGKSESQVYVSDTLPLIQKILVPNPKLWSPETPQIYTALSFLMLGDSIIDTYRTRFGIRQLQYIAHKGFLLNGQQRKFQGVCLHHDLGPLGTAVNPSAILHQLLLLKEMGCNAIRTSHNMPAPELVNLCDSIGMMMMIEPFDEWDIAKCRNGYHRYFNQWAERDMTNMLRRYRNNACVVMWSIGNEVPSQNNPEGIRVAKWLQEICHREDQTRPVTCGMDQVLTVLQNGFAAALDIPGFNYRTQYYQQAYNQLPQKFILGSETASTVSSRGTYMFPTIIKKGATYANHQSTGYDLEACTWSNLPDEDFALAQDYPWTLGQFVWTGFDYLGEPSPYDTDAWPSHSSLFGIFDLASLPKDRYYLYRSVWAPEKHTLHLLPHWTWPGREGETTPVFVYTNYPEAELFINGKSQGRQRKLSAQEAEQQKHTDPLYLQRRYRLMWTDIKYEPGELRVVAYDHHGHPVAQESLHTAGKPHHISLECSPTPLSAGTADLKYVTVSIRDKAGNLCPTANTLINFKVQGAGTFRAAANGDATNLDLFHIPYHHAFAGQLTAIVQSSCKSGNIQLKATAKGLKSATLEIPVR